MVRKSEVPWSEVQGPPYASRPNGTASTISLVRTVPAIKGSRISTTSPPSARLDAETFPPWKWIYRHGQTQPNAPSQPSRASSRR